MRRIFDYFRKHPHKEDEPVEPHPLAKKIIEHTKTELESQRERLIRLKRKAERIHKRRQKRR